MDFAQLIAQAQFKPRWVLDVGNFDAEPRGSAFRWSASQISTFQDCPRAWYFDKIEKRPRVERVSTYFGTLFHEFREAYFHSGQQPDEKNLDSDKVKEVAAYIREKNLVKTDCESEAIQHLKDAAKLAKLGLVHLPMPQMLNKTDIERKLNPSTAVGSVVGFVDFFLPDQGAVGYWPREMQWAPTNGVPLVGDHKSTAAKNYIKSINELTRADPQPALYGKAALDWTGNPESVDFLWHYNVKKGKKEAIPVRFRMSRAHIQERFGEVETTASKLLAIFDSKDSVKAQDVEPNPRACDKYGGCPHRDYCPLTNQQKIGALMNNGVNNPQMAFEAAMQQEIAQNQQSQNPALQAAQQMTQAPNGFMPPAAPAMQAQYMQAQPLGQQPPQQMQQPHNGYPQPPQNGYPQQMQQPQQFAAPQPAQQFAAPPAPPAVEPPAPQAPPPVVADAPPTLAEVGAAVNPPDAAAPDLEADVEDTKKKKPKKKATKAEKDFRNNAALQIYAALATAHWGISHEISNPSAKMARTAVEHADLLMEALEE